MTPAHENNLLTLILDSWDRNNQILINLLRALPPGGLQARALPTSPTVARMFTHMHYVRLIFLAEDAPQFTPQVPDREWLDIVDPEEIASQLDSSAKAVRHAVESLLLSGTPMLLHYDNPLLYLQHMIWHEGYHHGQIKLALKAAGHPFDDEEIGPCTWDLWLDKAPDHQARLERMKLR
ncbi:DinB family protein [Terracidiphilus gabretensis]|uniref:DinB family protein n=1 Tax=Terracidiphilus gabretensis TaxID=1577687 RepID=UPI00071BB9FA|nr:DinB family protein [Terracidiphilus gabretensis]